jgi:hypothetical protein
MNRPDRDSLHALLSAVVDGTASEEQVVELTRLLQSDSGARRFYVRYMDMHAALTSGQLPRATVRAHRTPWVAIVASLIAASLLVAWLVVPPTRRGGGGDRAGELEIAVAKAVPAGYVATVASASTDAVLDGKAVVPGVRLTQFASAVTPALLRRSSGTARIAGLSCELSPSTWRATAIDERTSSLMKTSPSVMDLPIRLTRVMATLLLWCFGR